MSAPINPKRPNPVLFRLVWIFVTIIIISGFIFVYQAYTTQPQSTQIFDLDAKDPAYSPPSKVPEPVLHNVKTSLGLEPNLKKAQLIVPDRPHDPNEKPTKNMKQDFQRRRTFLVSSNEKGIRIPDDPSPQKNTSINKSFRIVCIGASESFGWGVNYEFSYPAILEKTLGVTVINASAPAATPSGLVRWTKQNIQALEPDLIIFAIRPEYIEKNPVPSFQRDIQSLDTIAGDTPLLVVLPPLSTFDYQYPDIKRLYKNADDIVQEDFETIRKAIHPTPVLELTTIFREKQLQYKSPNPKDHIVLLQQNNNIQKLVSPSGETFLEARAPRIHHSPDSPSFIAVTIFQAFEQNKDLREPLFYDGGHPDKEGYELFALTVAEWIKKQEVLP